MAERDGLDLVRAVDAKIDQVRTKSLDVSFNELLDMHRSHELIIDPEYQRLFRWSEAKQSRFIESLILEMPIPPIFVIELDEGVYELIDGLQRISSYLHFRGEHPDCKNEDGSPEFLRLVDCDIVSELNDLTYTALPKALEIKLKRNFIRVEVLRKESDRRLRYHMFKRLNEGGELLTAQEIRNCTIRLLDNRINAFIIDLSQDPCFRTCVSTLPEGKTDERYDQELVLRFFAFKNDIDTYKHEITDFLTHYLERVASHLVEFDYDAEQELFKRTFRLLSATLGDNAFSGFNQQGTPINKFTSLHYEAIVLGVLPYVGHIDPTVPAEVEKMSAALLEIKKDNEFRRMTTGGGKNYVTQLRQRIGYVRDRLGATL